MPILGGLPAPPLNREQIALDVILGLPAALYAARSEDKITQAAQAKRIGIAKETLIRMEKPGAKPTLATVLAVLRWLSSGR